MKPTILKMVMLLLEKGNVMSMAFFVVNGDLLITQVKKLLHASTIAYVILPKDVRLYRRTSFGKITYAIVLACNNFFTCVINKSPFTTKKAILITFPFSNSSITIFKIVGFIK